jgi:aspartyl-tRNA synthetase
MNGWELASGGIRNNNPNAIMKVFEIMGYSKDEIMEKFGHMIDAYKFGAPQHGGCGFGCGHGFESPIKWPAQRFL